MGSIQEDVNSIRNLWTGFRTARVLLTANNLGIFQITKSPSTDNDIAKRLHLDKRATKILLDCLVSMKILNKKRGLYCNTALTNRLLVKGTPYYQGDMLRHADTMWHNWSALEDVVRTGKPARKKRDWESFIRAMHNISILKAEKIVNSLDLKGVKKVIDIGGGPGTYCIEFAKRGIISTIFDLPDTIRLAKDITKGFKKNINYLEGDILNDNIEGRYDLVFISQLFHAYSSEENLMITKKAVDTLNPNGMLVIQEFYINESMTEPLESALFCINMLVQTEHGRCYTVKEIKNWMKESGIKNISVIRPVDTVLVIGRKTKN